MKLKRISLFAWYIQQSNLKNTLTSNYLLFPSFIWLALDARDTMVPFLHVSKFPTLCLLSVFQKIMHIFVLFEVWVGVIVAALVEVRIIKARRGELVIEQAVRVVRLDILLVLKGNLIIAVLKKSLVDTANRKSASRLLVPFLLDREMQRTSGHESPT